MFSIVSSFLGGMGLFLSGMWLMTDGLKLAAGESLRELLHTWTNNRRRGLATGFLITALVQSSSAVTVATIGFANAGLLSLRQAVWVIFGSNVGTTMTGWLVALIGFKINIEAYALPLIGIGMLIRITGRKSRRAAIGQAVLGFGLFFLGIGVLKEAFDMIGAGYGLPGIEETGAGSILLYVVLGMVLTTLMQSSSAAIVITLSAAEGGMIPLSAAAATVIGANLGTTTTAILSVWGATATARRVAASHVSFNLITAFVAVIIIVPMLGITSWVEEVLNLAAAPATTLAIFHTIFNVLGVLLMWPLADALIQFLSKRFVSEQELAGRPMFLDQTALEVPALASVALMKEINGLNRKAVSMAMDAINAAGQEERFTADHENISRLATSIGEYVARLSRTNLPENIATRLPEVIRVVQQYVWISELTQDIIVLEKDINIRQQENIITAVKNLKQDAALILQSAFIDIPGLDVNELKQGLVELEKDYDNLRLVVLRAGAEGDLAMVTVDNQLDQANIIRRTVKQVVKATSLHARLISEFAIDPSALWNITQPLLESEVKPV